MVYFRDDTNMFVGVEVCDLERMLQALHVAKLHDAVLRVNSAMNLGIYKPGPTVEGHGYFYQGYIDMSDATLSLCMPTDEKAQLKEVDRCISLVELERILQTWTLSPNAENQKHYRLFPSKRGNLAISTHVVEGPQGPCGYYIGWIDFSEERLILFSKEFPGASENSWMVGGKVDIECGTGHEFNAPNREVAMQGG